MGLCFNDIFLLIFLLSYKLQMHFIDVLHQLLDRSLFCLVELLFETVTACFKLFDLQNNENCV